jgi:hypothetical protein
MDMSRRLPCHRRQLGNTSRRRPSSSRPTRKSIEAVITCAVASAVAAAAPFKQSTEVGSVRRYSHCEHGHGSYICMAGSGETLSVGAAAADAVAAVLRPGYIGA